MTEEIKVPTTETVEPTEEQVEVKTEKTEKLYTRAEVEAIKKAEREILIKEQEKKRSEAEKLAQMNAEEKARYQLEAVERERNEALAKLNAYELEKEAFKIAEEKGVPHALLKAIDFTTVKAEQLTDIIDNLEVVYKQSVELGISEKLKEKAPKTVVGSLPPTRKSRESI